MTLRKPRFWIAVVLFVVSLALLWAAVVPAPREEQSVPMPVVTLPVPETWHFQLDQAGG